MLLFGIISYILGLIQFTIPGYEGVLSDLREVPLLISVFYISNPLYLIGVSLITALGTPPDGSYVTTLLMHTFGLIASWYFFDFIRKKKIQFYLTGLLWFINVLFYYLCFLIPVLILINYMVGINTEKSFFYFYKELLFSVRFELISSGIITSLYLVQFTLRHELEKHKGNLEILVKERTDDLEIANEKLIALNATKDKFFSIIAHDLREPFSSMLVFSDLLIDKFESFNVLQQKKQLNIMSESIHNTYRLLENLLLWSHGQSGTIEFNQKKENLFLLCLETEKSLNQVFVNKSISYFNNVPGDLSVFVDKDMFLTVMRNLISNALKFTQEGGVITINTKPQENEIIVSVNDTGIGMNKEKQEKLFNITQKTSTLGTNKEKGTGLGLVLCKQFIERHGGKIWIKSQESIGSTIYFSIPIGDK